MTITRKFKRDHMSKRYSIQVRRYMSGQGNWTGCYTVTEIIQRTLKAEQIGNFCPLFCTYKGKNALVHSDQGDLSDPFRRDQSYAKSLFITIA